MFAQKNIFAVVPPWLLREVAKTRVGEANNM